MGDDESFSVTMDLEEGYRFDVDFGVGGDTRFVMDEPSPLGEGTGPNAARVLAAAVGNCLSASLLYCLRRARIEVTGVRTSVSGVLERNDAGRLRVGGLTVQIEPQVSADDEPRMRRCLELFEDFCIVSESVRHGIGVEVAVTPVSAAAG